MKRFSDELVYVFGLPVMQVYKYSNFDCSECCLGGGLCMNNPEFKRYALGGICKFSYHYEMFPR